MDYADRKELYRLENYVERLERQRRFYRETDELEWSIDGDRGPVDDKMVRYNLGPLEGFLDIWNSVDDAVRDIRSEEGLQQGFDPARKRYRKLKDRIFENSDFLADVYDLDKPLGRMKVEARYS